jgi:hypothetical protein
MRSLAKLMGDFVHHRLLELYHGESLSESQYLNSDLLATDDFSLPLVNISSNTRKKAKRGQKAAKTAFLSR